MVVAIVGGGIVGLTTAIALREAGFDATVFDRAKDVAASQIGAGLGLALNATRVMRALGLLDRLRGVAAPGERFEFRDRKGKLLSSWEIPDGELQFGITRRALHELLLGALPPDALVPDKTCTGYELHEDNTTVLFADGTSFTADGLIGADGLRSIVRAQTLGEEPPRYAGFSVLRCLVPVSGDDPLPRGVFRLFWGPATCIGMYHVATDLVYTFGWWPGPEGAHVERGARKQALLNRFSGWSREVGELIAGMQEDDIHQTDIYDRPPASQWGNGRVTLAGDAAHPMTFNMGQGACQGMEDAVALAQSLAKFPDVPAGLRAYESERTHRSARITAMSARVARMSLMGSPAWRIRNFALRAVGRNISRGEKMLKIDAEIPKVGVCTLA